jgi:hypothetical protein
VTSYQRAWAKILLMCLSSLQELLYSRVTSRLPLMVNVSCRAHAQANEHRPPERPINKRTHDSMRLLYYVGPDMAQNDMAGM